MLTQTHHIRVKYQHEIHSNQKQLKSILSEFNPQKQQQKLDTIRPDQNYNSDRDRWKSINLSE